MNQNPECIFCLITQGGAPAEIVYQDEAVTAFMDIYPVTPGHVLIVPNVHVPDLAGLSDDHAGRMMALARKIAAAMRNSDLQCEAANLFLADGAAAGQTVFHNHLHVIPRFDGDGSGIRLHGDNVGSISAGSLKGHATLIRSALEASDG